MSNRDIVENPHSNHVPDGCILLARKMQDSEIWKKPADWLKIWIYILQEVNHSDRKQFKRGENFFNLIDVARDCGVSRHSVYKFIKWAKSATLLATQKTTRGVVISVLNYDRYQNLENYKSTRGDTLGEIEAKQKRYYKQELKNEKNTNARAEKISTEVGKGVVLPEFLTTVRNNLLEVIGIEDFTEEPKDQIKLMRKIGRLLDGLSEERRAQLWAQFTSYYGIGNFRHLDSVYKHLKAITPKSS